MYLFSIFTHVSDKCRWLICVTVPFRVVVSFSVFFFFLFTCFHPPVGRYWGKAAHFFLCDAITLTVVHRPLDVTLALTAVLEEM